MDTTITGGVLQDESSNNNDATVTNVTVVPGRVGNALQFQSNGTGVIQQAASTGGDTPSSVALWVRVAALPPMPMGRYGCVDSGQRTAVFIYGDGSVRCSHNLPANGVLFSATGVVTANTWLHIACVYDGVENIMFLDGVRVASIPATGALMLLSGTLTLGQNEPTGDVLNGALDEVHLYNRVLTETEVCRLAGTC